MREKCKCISYNQPEDWQKETILNPPFQEKSVCVDYCIADVIQLLWKKGIHTLGSCCGHNEVNPSIIVSDNKLLSIQIEEIISAKDKDGVWNIYEWRLTKIN